MKEFLRKFFVVFRRVNYLVFRGAANTIKFLWKHREGISVSSAGILLAAAVIGTVKFSFINKMEIHLFRALNMPFEQMMISGIKVMYAPFFLINMIIIVACTGFLFTVYSSKRMKPEKFRTALINGLVVAAVIIIYAALIKLFLADKAYNAQIILYAAEIAILSFFFFKKDRYNGINIKPGIYMTGKEKTRLAAFTAAMLVLYLFDYASWKYSFIGDEYAFYKFAKEIADGTRPLALFYERGVYGDHPNLASIYPGIMMKIFGTGLFGWKVSSAIIPAISLPPFYMWVKLMSNRRVAVISAAAFGFSLTLLAFSHIAHDIIHAVFPFVLSMLLVELAIRKNSSFWSFLSGAVMGLGCYTFYTARLTVIVAAIYWFFHPARKKYSRANLFTGLAVYFATIIFLFLNPDFLKNMFIHSVVSGSEVSEASARPVYMILNYVHTYLSFLYKDNLTHFMDGAITDKITAAGILFGFAWMITSAAKNWRARFLLVSYSVLVFFIGAIAQYKYPPNTRVNFLIPLLAVIAAFGLARIIVFAAGYFRKRKDAAKVMLAAVLALIASFNIYRFYFHMPSVFHFTRETYLIKYMTTAAPDRPRVLVADKQVVMDILADLYGFSGNLEILNGEEFRKKLINNELKGKVIILANDVAGSRTDVINFAGALNTLYDFRYNGAYYIFDNDDDENYYKGFRDLWLTGKTSYIPPPPEGRVKRKGKKMPKIKMAGPKEKSGARYSKYEKKVITEKKRDFKPSGTYRYTAHYALNDFSIDRLKLKGAMAYPTDIDVSADGKKIFVADSGKNRILIYVLVKEGIYELEAKPDVKPAAAGIFNFFKSKGGSRNDIYLAYNREFDSVYVLDNSAGVVKEYDAAGNMKKVVISGTFLRHAKYISCAPGGLLLMTANARANMIVVFNIDGEIISAYSTARGGGRGQLKNPHYAVMDSGNDVYVVDGLNDRVQIFDRDWTFKDQIRTGRYIPDYPPKITVIEKKDALYFAVNQPELKKLLLYPADASFSRGIDSAKLTAAGIKKAGPITSDASGGIYMLDPESKSVFRIIIKEDFIPHSVRGRGASKKP